MAKIDSLHSLPAIAAREQADASLGAAFAAVDFDLAPQQRSTALGRTFSFKPREQP